MINNLAKKGNVLQMRYLSLRIIPCLDDAKFVSNSAEMVINVIINHKPHKLNIPTLCIDECPLLTYNLMLIIHGTFLKVIK